MGFNKHIWSNIKLAFKNLILIYIIIGVLLVTGSLYYLDEKKFFYKICYTLGTTLLAGGVFASIAKGSQFAEIFSKILRDIIYGHEHLENRKDLEKIGKM